MRYWVRLLKIILPYKRKDIIAVSLLVPSILYGGHLLSTFDRSDFQFSCNWVSNHFDPNTLAGRSFNIVIVSTQGFYTCKKENPYESKTK